MTEHRRWPEGSTFVFTPSYPDATDQELLAGWYRAAMHRRLRSTGNVEVFRPEGEAPWAEGPVRELRKGEPMSTEQVPSVGRDVHYVSYGTPRGEFTSQCRAAKITEVPLDTDRETIGLVVYNPTGLFFHPLAAGGCDHDEADHNGGTWHWPERVG